MRPRTSIPIRVVSMMALAALIGGFPVVRAAGAKPSSPHASSHTTGRAVFRATTSFGRAARPAGAPPASGLSLERIRLIEEDRDEPELPVPAAAAPAVDGAPIAGEPSSLIEEFDGLDAFDNDSVTGLNVEPPDQGLCVGAGHVLESINSTIRPFDDAGHAEQPPIGLNRFYGLPPAFDAARDRFGPLLTDPSCVYDPATKRFFHVVLTLDADPASGDPVGPNHLDIAVSRTKDPTGRWNLYRIDVTNDGSDGTPDHDCPGETEGSTGPCVGDYPQIGLDRNGFFVTTNEYALFDPDERFMGAQAYAMSKAALAAGTSNVSFVSFEHLQVPEREQMAFTLRAANAPGTRWSAAKHGTLFLVSGMVGIETGNPSPDYDAITLWALSNTASLDSPQPNLGLRHAVVPTHAYQIPPPSAQRPGHLPLGECLNLAPCIGAFGAPPSPQGLSNVDSLDGRMLGAWLADGMLWFALGTAVEVGGRDLAGVLYGGLVPSFREGTLRGRVRLQHYVGVEGNNLVMPAIAVDGDGGGYLVFTLVGPDHYPSAAVARVSSTRPPSQVRIVEPGSGPQDGFTGYWIGQGRPRWGDYSGAAVDEHGHVWLATEYIAQTCAFQTWIGGDLTCGGTRGAFANFATRVMGSGRPRALRRAASKDIPRSTRGFR